MNLFLMTALASAPFWLLLVMVTFLLARWRFRRHHKLLGLFAVASFGGMVYGLLRYNGVIVFAHDTFVSYHWFGSSHGDEGFQYICTCGSILLGLFMAYFYKGKNI